MLTFSSKIPLKLHVTPLLVKVRIMNLEHFTHASDLKEKDLIKFINAQFI